MDPFLYEPIFLAVTSLLSYALSLHYIASFRSPQQQTGLFFPLFLSLILCFWIGGRPISGAAFGDTINYALEYGMMDAAGRDVSMNWSSEWIWSLLMVTCKKTGLGISAFFTVVAAGYVLSSLWAVKRFMPSNPLLGMLFVWTSLMFFPFGVNGIRNGLACHVMLLAMSFFFDDKYIVGILLCLLSFGLHRSVMLPIVAMLAGRYIIKNYKIAVVIWLGAIIVSLLAGEIFTNLLAMLGFDDRLASYNTSKYAESFSSTGFRWDFLLYSSFPILMGWYVCEKKKIRDDWYKTLCIAYCLCNAFWVLVIRIAFSNRFAYLSWFMYPIVIAYPLINLPLWEDQGKKTGMILAVYCSFTLFINTFLW